MYFIEVHSKLNQMISVLYRLGLWHRGDEPSVRETRVKLICSSFFFLCPISLITGAFSSDNRYDFIFALETAIMSIPLLVEFLHLIWKKKDIVELLHRIGVYSTDDHNEFTLINDKLNIFMKVMNVFFASAIVVVLSFGLGVPIFTSERTLFINIGFPFDWKNNDIAYWAAAGFLFGQAILGIISIIFTIIKWYLMINCALKYKILGKQIQNMGKENAYQRDLILAIHSQQDINESTCQLESFLSNTLSVQIATSGMCICCSIFCLAFNNNNLVEYAIYLYILLYNTFNILMVTYLGNEITLSSDRLSYCLFESDWMDQSESCKKSVLIFGERLKKPQELVTLQIYPLTLETFMRILNSAYSMFNIMKNFK